MAKINFTAALTCMRNGESGVKTKIWAVAPTRVPWSDIDNLHIGGDRSYYDPGMNPKDEQVHPTWVMALQNQDEGEEDLRDVQAMLPVTFTPDDHDVGLANNEFSSPKIRRYHAARREAWPTPALPAGHPDDLDGCYFSIDRAGVCHVYLDMRSNWRSDYDDAEPDWDPGDPPPTKTALGPEQDAWVETLVARDDVVGFVWHHSLGWGGRADDPGFGAKRDHPAFYDSWRRWFAYTIGQRPGLILSGDNHITGGSLSDPYAGLLWLHYAGANRLSGNTTWDPEFDADKIWPPRAIDEDDPDDPGVDVVLNCVGYYRTIWSGKTLTIQAWVHDCDADVIRHEMTRSWAVADEGGGGIPGPTFRIDETLWLHDTEAVIPRWKLAWGNGTIPFAGKDLGLVASAFGGETVGGIRRTGHRLPLTVIVSDLDRLGYPGGTVQLDANIDEFRAKYNIEDKVLLEYFPRSDGSVTRLAYAYFSAEVAPQRDGLTLARLPIVADIHSDSWAGPSELVWSRLLPDTGDIADEPITTLSGSTAKIPDATLWLEGPHSGATYTDTQTQRWVRITAPGPGESVPDGKWSVLAARPRRVYIVDGPDSELTDADMVRGWIRSGGPVPSTTRLLLPLTPYRKVVRMSAHVHGEGKNELQLIVKATPRF